MIIGVIVAGVVWNSRSHHRDVSEQVLADNAALVVGRADAPVTIDVFEDYQCPVCKQFEASSGTAIDRAVAAGKVRVRYHLLTFLNRNSGSGDYSSRAAGAALCVAQREPERVFWAFHSALFRDQPPEHGNDFTNAQLGARAEAAGASAATAQCITSGADIARADQFASQSTSQLANGLGGRAGTPSVLVAGRSVGGLLDGTGWLDKLIANSSTAR